MFVKETFLFQQGRRSFGILGIWKGIVVCNFLLVPNYYQFMWKSQVIWFLWKTYWFVKQLKHSCRDIKPGNTPRGVILWFWKSREVGWCGELDVQQIWEFCWACLQPAPCSGQWILSPQFDRLPLLLLEVERREPDWSPTHSMFFSFF